MDTDPVDVYDFTDDEEDYNLDIITNTLIRLRNSLENSELYRNNREMVSEFTITMSSLFDVLIPNDHTPLPDTLTHQEFENLTIYNGIPDNECYICLEKNETYTCIILKCNHIFHKTCLKEWLTKESTKCPMCRTCVKS